MGSICFESFGLRGGVHLIPFNPIWWCRLRPCQLDFIVFSNMEGVNLFMITHDDNVTEPSNMWQNDGGEVFRYMIISMEYWNISRNVLALSYESCIYGLSQFQSTLASTILDISGSSGHHYTNSVILVSLGASLAKSK